MKYNELIEAIVREVPEAKDAIAIENVRYLRDENHAYFSFLSDVLIGEKGFFAIKRLLEKTFPALRVSLRIASPSLARAFLETPEKYCLPLNQYLLRAFPAIRSWEFDLRWRSGNGKIVLEVPDAFAMNFLKTQDCEARLTEAVKNIYRVDTDVRIQVAGDSERRLQAILDARDQENQEKQKQFEEERSHPKAAPKAETAKPKDNKIRGRAIADDPVEIGEITEPGGVFTVRGKVLSVETREISGGEGLLLSFDMTDYTGSIKCKLFLYYRDRRLSRDAQEKLPPISAEERAKVDGVVARIKPGNGILARGEVQDDRFSHELVLMAKDLTAVDLPERMDDAEEKRIEMHLHTQMSTMDAVTSAEALIARIGQIEPIWNDDINQRKLQFDEMLRSGSCEDLVSIIKSLLAQRNRRLAEGKMLHVSDENYLREAQRLLFDELAGVLGVTPKDVEARLKDALNKA